MDPVVCLWTPSFQLEFCPFFIIMDQRLVHYLWQFSAGDADLCCRIAALWLLTICSNWAAHFHYIIWPNVDQIYMTIFTCFVQELWRSGLRNILDYNVIYLPLGLHYLHCRAFPCVAVLSFLPCLSTMREAWSVCLALCAVLPGLPHRSAQKTGG